MAELDLQSGNLFAGSGLAPELNVPSSDLALSPALLARAAGAGPPVPNSAGAGAVPQDQTQAAIQDLVSNPQVAEMLRQRFATQNEMIAKGRAKDAMNRHKFEQAQFIGNILHAFGGGDVDRRTADQALGARVQNEQRAREQAERRFLQEQAAQDADPNSTTNQLFRHQMGPLFDAAGIPPELQGNFTKQFVTSQGGLLKSVIGVRQQQLARDMQQDRIEADQQFQLDRDEQAHQHRLDEIAKKYKRRSRPGGGNKTTMDDKQLLSLAGGDPLVAQALRDNKKLREKALEQRLKSTSEASSPEAQSSISRTAKSLGMTASQFSHEVEKYSKRRESVAELDTISSSLNDKVQTIISSGREIQGVGIISGAVPFAALTTDEARAVRQGLASLRNVILKARAGSAVSAEEAARMYEELGIGAGRTMNDLLRGLANVRDTLEAKMGTIAGGFPPEVVQQYHKNQIRNRTSRLYMMDTDTGEIKAGAPGKVRDFLTRKEAEEPGRYRLVDAPGGE